MTRMVRPMTIEDEQGDSITIDALDVTDFDVSNCMLTIEHQYQEHLHFPSKSNSEIFRMFNAKLYNALNAPVLVTREVLAELPKDAKALAYFVYYGSDDDAIDEWREAKWDDMYEKWEYNSFGIFPVINRDDDSWYILKSNGCFKTLDYLLQFYTDGTPVVVQ